MKLCAPPPPLPIGPHASDELALYVPRKWTDRLQAHVRFMDGDWHVWRRVALNITGPGGWNRACGFQFLFDQRKDAEIRVTFETGASWSYEGQYCLGVPPDKPTMQLGWLKANTPDAEVRRVALHEFGHALGFIHEHASPEAHIPWDKEAVYDYYLRSHGWDRAMVDAQVLTPTAAEVVDAGDYDPQSILHYYIPPEFVLDHVARGGYGDLTPMDIKMAEHWYGPPPPLPIAPPQEKQTWKLYFPFGARN